MPYLTDPTEEIILLEADLAACCERMAALTAKKRALQARSPYLAELAALQRRLAVVEDAARFARSVIESRGMFDRSEQLAYEKLTAALAGTEVTP